MKREEIERGITQRLRQAVVTAGYLPDKTLFLTPALYEAAKVTLKEAEDSTFQLIEVFGIGSPESKQEKAVSRFVVSRIDESPAGLGGFSVQKNELVTPQDGDNPPVYNRIQYPPRQVTLQYEVRMITNTTKYDRIMMELLYVALPNYSHIHPWVDGSGFNTSDSFLLVHLGTAPVKNDTTYMERVFRVNVPEVWVEDMRVVREVVPAIVKIDVQIQDGEGNDLETLTIE